MRYLVTGASGFIGRAFALHAAASPGGSVRACSRQALQLKVPGLQIIQVDRYDDHRSMVNALADVDVVVHAAGRAHILEEDTRDPLASFRQANVDITCRLARQAAASGVKRFIFLSSIGVNGESTTTPFTEQHTPAPTSLYAFAKYEAEQALLAIANETGLEVVIVRPPLVTGPNAPGNFGRLVRLARTGIPLPFGGLRNKRSVIGIDNLCDVLGVVCQHPAAANQTFLVADPQDVSTSELITALRQGMNMHPRLVSMPAMPIRACMRVLGRARLAQQLYGDLQLSSAKACSTLGWKPPYDTLVSLVRAVGYAQARVSPA